MRIKIDNKRVAVIGFNYDTGESLFVPPWGRKVNEPCLFTTASVRIEEQETKNLLAIATHTVKAFNMFGPNHIIQRKLALKGAFRKLENSGFKKPEYCISREDRKLIWRRLRTVYGFKLIPGEKNVATSDYSITEKLRTLAVDKITRSQVNYYF